jgi:integrase
MVYNYMLVMTNTGMRTIEAYHLRWRDIDHRTDRQGRAFVCLNVRGKKKYRELIAPNSVAEYFDRIRAISKATKPDDFVFTSYDGTANASYYKTPIKDLLEGSGLLVGAAGTERSAYCFRHSYATFRLMEGVDVYFLAKQMGTSVKMIEDHYGHITPSTSTDQILQGMPGWLPVSNGGAAQPTEPPVAPSEARQSTKAPRSRRTRRPKRPTGSAPSGSEDPPSPPDAE